MTVLSQVDMDRWLERCRIMCWSADMLTKGLSSIDQRKRKMYAHMMSVYGVSSAVSVPQSHDVGIDIYLD